MKLAQLDFSKIQIPTNNNGLVNINDPNLSLGKIISSLIPIIFALAGILLLIYLLYGGFHLMTSAGDPKGVAEAKGKITNALIGFIVIFLAFWIVQIIGLVFNLPGITIIFK